MKVTYTAPNRGHHYRYALALDKADILHKFVSGFSRFSPRAGLPELGEKLVRADVIQNVFLMSLKAKFPPSISSMFAYWAKVEQCKTSIQFLAESDIFLFYSGCGFEGCKVMQRFGKVAISEAVNSHVHYQEEILKEEYQLNNLNWQPFHQREKERRIAEYEMANYILLPSEFVMRSFIKLGFAPSKLIKVPYGFNKLTSKEVEPKNYRGNEFTILYVGSISVRKGLRYLIEAFRAFNHPHKKLVIVGPESQPSGLQQIIIPNNVIFTGVLKGIELESAYRSATVFCLPSIEEGLALVLGEALSFGIPIIATENTGADDIITDGREGFIVPIRSSDSILEKLELLASNPSFYEEIRANAHQKAQSLNGWDQTGNILVSSLIQRCQKT